MKKDFFARIGPLILLVLFSQGCGGGSSSSQPQPPETTGPTTPQEAINDAVSQGIDGIFVYVDQANKSPLSIAAGIQDRSTQQPADPETLFKIASISKLFIAVSAAKLDFQQTINLDDTLIFWLPEIGARIENADSITIRLLLQHRSGVPDFDSQTGFSWQNSHTNIDDTLAFALDLDADFSPNERYEYSNTNYILVAKILDKALGISHTTFIKDNILIPLELLDTFSLYSEIDPTRLAKGYWENQERSQQEYLIPGGSMISTVKDTAIFLRALNKGELLNSQEQAIYDSVYFLGHSGWLPGFQSIAQYNQQIDATVIQFINTTGGNSEAVASATYEAIIDSL